MYSLFQSQGSSPQILKQKLLYYSLVESLLSKVIPKSLIIIRVAQISPDAEFHLTLALSAKQLSLDEPFYLMMVVVGFRLSGETVENHPQHREHLKNVALLYNLNQAV